MLKSENPCPLSHELINKKKSIILMRSAPCITHITLSSPKRFALEFCTYCSFNFLDKFCSRLLVDNKLVILRFP